MNVEAQKTEDRKGDAINMTLEEYISRYQKEDLYLVESVPYEMLSKLIVLFTFLPTAMVM